jgi:hypothetical protein
MERMDSFISTWLHLKPTIGDGLDVTARSLRRIPEFPDSLDEHPLQRLRVQAASTGGFQSILNACVHSGFQYDRSEPWTPRNLVDGSSSASLLA